MKRRWLAKLLSSLFTIGILVFAVYMLIPFLHSVKNLETAQTTAPNTSTEDPFVTKLKIENQAKYFDINTLGSGQQIVHSIKQVPVQNGWINTAPLDFKTLAQQQRLVLVNFWTYSSINCYRAMPYLEELWQRYKDYGLVVVGIHSPEFEFEKDPSHILAAVRREKITFPVVTDGDKVLSNKFGNRYWPGKYLIDSRGEVVYTQLGEGGYAAEEKVIREKLAAAGWHLPPVKPIAMFLQPSLQPVTPDLYAGAGFVRRRLGNDAQPVLKRTTDYILPKQLEPDVLYLSGSWKASYDYVQSTTPAQVQVNYQSNSIYAILDQALAPIWVEVQWDGLPIPQAWQGKDIVIRDGKTYLHVTEPRLYFPLKNHTPYGRHTLTLLTPVGLRFYGFSFGAYGNA
jgi:thiol-disulfide isomerase/thioredoxin